MSQSIIPINPWVLGKQNTQQQEHIAGLRPLVLPVFVWFAWAVVADLIRAPAVVAVAWAGRTISLLYPVKVTLW
jgi:hypothetical protein